MSFISELVDDVIETIVGAPEVYGPYLEPIEKSDDQPNNGTSYYCERSNQKFIILSEDFDSLKVKSTAARLWLKHWEDELEEAERYVEHTKKMIQEMKRASSARGAISVADPSGSVSIAKKTAFIQA